MKAFFKSKICTFDELLPSQLMRGFLFGETFFTSIRTWKGHVLFWEEHLARLQASLDFSLSGDRNSNQKILERLKLELSLLLKILNEKAETDFYLRPTFFWRPQDGLSSQELDTAWGLPRVGVELDFIIFWKPLNLPFPISHSNLIKAEVSMSGVLDSFTGGHNQVKTGQYFFAINEKDSFEKILCSPGGMILEGRWANVFFYRNYQYLTPCLKNHGGLEGIMRQNLLKFFQSKNIPYSVCDIHQNELPSMEEMFLTNCLKGIVPVNTIRWSPNSKVSDGSFSSQIFSTKETKTVLMVKEFEIYCEKKFSIF